MSAVASLASSTPSSSTNSHTCTTRARTYEAGQALTGTPLAEAPLGSAPLGAAPLGGIPPVGSAPQADDILGVLALRILGVPGRETPDGIQGQGRHLQRRSEQRHPSGGPSSPDDRMRQSSERPERGQSSDPHQR